MFNKLTIYLKVSKDHQNPHIEEISDQGYTLKIINTFKSNIENHFGKYLLIVPFGKYS